MLSNTVAIGPETIAAYVGVGVTGLLGSLALILSIKGLSIQKESARAATISAEAAQRANWLTEQRMLHELSRQSSPLGGQNASHPDVRWVLDRKGKNSFVLRNVGTTTALNVRVPPESAGKLARNLPEAATLRPSESAEFLMMGAWGEPVPNEILVVSEGYEDNPQVVPVPQ